MKESSPLDLLPCGLCIAVQLQTTKEASPVCRNGNRTDRFDRPLHTVPKSGTLIVPIFGTIMKAHEVLFPGTRRGVLALYFLNPQQRFFLREVARRLKSGHSTIQKEVEHLWKAGLLTRHREGRRIEYQANREAFAFEELRALLERTVGWVGGLHEALRPLRKDIDCAFIYGSIAADTATAESDVDLMVIGDVPFEKVVRAVRRVQDELGREVNPSVFTRSEFREKLAAGVPFLKRVMAGPKKFIIGEARELEAME
jgi:predicted nucleotidyltransferase